ncbi:YdcF family protein [Pelobacter propionicus]|uniref:DUF218 domain-containing protein n=1 Tax=Pelobacter propionicus (strain DSM 2379 / NBRC 103807 / OttBd1) TaxID=338966 RepID=A1ART1_PELPD|nr:YdcF family protein [Pelobacter propionicus]ABL00052.1 protein of unknown function DUF218 [Pelobacter propionicus DSM 2379]
MKSITTRYVRWLFIVAALWLILVAFPSVPSVRAWLAAPLVVQNMHARGDACYVLAGGGALWERLDAAADLVQMGRVPLILLMRDDSRGQYRFTARTSWSRTQWAVDYLAWRGVPKERIVLLSPVEGALGTLAEARAVARHLSKQVKSLVLVSSAPHMRRTVLAFRRSLPSAVGVIPYAATSLENSFELYHPIWLEYLKLLVYLVIA